MSKYSIKYYLEHKDKIIENVKQYYLEHRDEKRQYHIQYYYTHVNDITFRIKKKVKGLQPLTIENKNIILYF